MDHSDPIPPEPTPAQDAAVAAVAAELNQITGDILHLHWKMGAIVEAFIANIDIDMHGKNPMRRLLKQTRNSVTDLYDLSKLWVNTSETEIKILMAAGVTTADAIKGLKITDKHKRLSKLGIPTDVLNSKGSK